MSDRLRQRFEEFDWHLLAVALVLSLIGMVFLWSATLGPDGLSGRTLSRQMMYLGVSLPMVAVVVRVRYTVLSRLAAPLYLLAILVLMFLLLRSGGEVRKTNSWIRLPLGFGLQPSEFCKLAVIVMIAAWLRFRETPRRLRDLIGPLALTLFPAALVAKQPDLGSAVLLLPVVIAMLVAAGLRFRLLLLLLGGGLAAATAFYYSPLLQDYQRSRVQSFLESIPEKTQQAQDLRGQARHAEANAVERELRALKQGASMQVYHAMISIGSGGTFGQGIGQGRHKLLDYLPERHNDFIFAVVGEEWGFLGCSLVLACSFLLIWLIIAVARRTRDPFGRLICVGIATLFTSQIVLNTGVATGMLPVTGVTLPFLSAGGSSLMASFLAVGLVLSVGAHKVLVLDGHSYRHAAIGEQ